MIKKKEAKEKIFEPNEYPLDKGIKLIEASAGTGKTFSLSHIVLRLLTEKEYSINEILIVSFTKATASEIKSRIVKRIINAIKGLELIIKGVEPDFVDSVLYEWLKINEVNLKNCHYWISLLLIALERIDQADITTIHGFCLKTIRREAIEIGSAIDPIVHNDDNELIKEISYEYWNKQILKLHPNHIKGLRKSGLNVDILTEAIKRIDNDPTLDFKIDNHNFNIQKPLLNQFNELFIKYWNNFMEIWKEEGQELDENLKSFAQLLRDHGISDTKPYSPNPKKNRYQLLTEWVESLNYDQTKNNNFNKPYYIDIRNQKLFSDYYHPINLHELKQRHEFNNIDNFAPDLHRSISQLWDGPAEMVWNHSIGWAINLLSIKRKDNGIMSNGDLLKALDPSKNKKGIYSKKVFINKLRLRYKAVLVDEFQDTDPIQWRFLKHVFGESQDHLLLMIGDPKQAIYRFRGGDLNTYLKARNEAHRIDYLVDNFRTTPRLMSGLNSFLSQGLLRSNLKIIPLTPRSENECLPLKENEHPLEIIRIDEDSTELNNSKNILETKSKLEEQIPSIVVNKILTLLKNHPKELHPADICILVNNHNQAEDIRAALSTSSLPSKLISKGDVFKSEAATILQKFLNCLANPGNIKDLRIIACSTLIQWNPKDFLEAEKNGQFDELANRFLYWSNNLENLGLSTCLFELLESRFLADFSKRGRLLSDLNQCSQLVEEEIHRQGLEVKGAAKWFRRERLRSDESIHEERQPNSDVDENSINVITIHRSKGLQYEIVICPYLWQAPPISKGPLWRNVPYQKWTIALSKGWNENKNLTDNALNESLQEYERLAYVAFTRAEKQLLIIWARALNQEGNPLTCFLFGPNEIHSKLESLTNEKMDKWIDNNKLPITICSIQPNIKNKCWEPIRIKDPLSLGPRPKRSLDTIWGRYSYSSWIAKPNINLLKFSDSLEFEEGRDIDKQDIEDVTDKQKDSINSKSKVPNIFSDWREESPFQEFPRGATAGDCLHKILEKLDFQNQITSPRTTDLISNELRKSGLDINLLTSVQEGLQRILNVPLSGPLCNLKFNQLQREERIHELKFDIPVSHKGNPIKSIDIANAFLKDPNSLFGYSYSKRLLELNIISKGFLTGSIDLVFADNIDKSKARWWVVDWKSNWIGEETDNKSLCGPHHYHSKNMQDQMVLHHYPLQAHLYLIALHRLLSWRLKNYSIYSHLGGYIYVFLRGIPSEDLIKKNHKSIQTPGIIIEKAPIERVLEINKILEKGGL